MRDGITDAWRAVFWWDRTTRAKAYRVSNRHEQSVGLWSNGVVIIMIPTTKTTTFGTYVYAFESLKHGPGRSTSLAKSDGL